MSPGITSVYCYHCHVLVTVCMTLFLYLCVYKCLCVCDCVCVFSACQNHSFSLSGRDAAIAFTDRIKSGVVGEQLWLQISEPTDKDKGKYAIEFFDGKGGLRRTVELSGQGESIHRCWKEWTSLFALTLLYQMCWHLLVCLFFWPCSIWWCLCRVPETQVSNSELGWGLSSMQKYKVRIRVSPVSWSHYLQPLYSTSHPVNLQSGCYCRKK